MMVDETRVVILTIPCPGKDEERKAAWGYLFRAYRDIRGGPVPFTYGRVGDLLTRHYNGDSWKGMAMRRVLHEWSYITLKEKDIE